MKPRPFLPAGALALALAAPAMAQTSQTLGDPQPLEQLKQVYLQCDQWSMQQPLRPGLAAHCSVAAEQLLQRGFGGDFDALLAWWRGARSSVKAQLSQPSLRPRS